MSDEEEDWEIWMSGKYEEEGLEAEGQESSEDLGSEDREDEGMSGSKKLPGHLVISFT